MTAPDKGKTEKACLSEKRQAYACGFKKFAYINARLRMSLALALSLSLSLSLSLT
jgi:hypothetical protein